MTVLYGHNAKCLEVLEQLDKLPGIQEPEAAKARAATREAFMRLDRARSAFGQYQAARKNIESILAMPIRTPKSRAQLRKALENCDHAQETLARALEGWE